jgi:hypothetical protein
MIERLISHVTYENEAILVAALGLLFYGAVILGVV